MSLFGPPNVEKMKARRDVNGLIKALEYQRVSRETMVRVSYRESPGVQEAGDIRAKAIKALEEIGDIRAVEPLITALKKEPFDDYREDVARALGSLGDTRAIEPLEEALQHDKLGVQKQAQMALKLLGWKGKEKQFNFL